MKKIMILGGNKAQVPLIEAAKREGYHVVLIDYTTTNPGIPLADTHYQVNFMDREEVLRIARLEQIQGVISNSEAAMTVVAYISEECGLVGNTLESILNISSKINFRILQKKIGVFAPEHMVTTSFEEALKNVDNLRFPIVIKPSKSSGSRGTTVISDKDYLLAHKELWDACSEFSMDNNVVLEEYLEMQAPGATIESELFVCDGQYFWDGLFTNERRLDALSIPMTNIFPPLLSEAQVSEVKNTLIRLFEGAGIAFGEYNIELFFTTRGDLFCIEVNARQGGCGMPDLVQKHCGVDMYRLLVTTVMGDNSYFERILSEDRFKKYVVRQEVFSDTDGEFQQLHIAPELQPYVMDIHYLCHPGDKVNAFHKANDIVAWVDLEFSDREQQLFFLKKIKEEIYPVVK